MTYKSLWHTSKAIITRKFIVMSVYVKRIKRSQISDLILHHKCLEK
jgi:hypothetical protein